MLFLLILSCLSQLVASQPPLPPAGLEVSRRTGDIQGPFVGVQSAAIPWQRQLFFPNSDASAPSSPDSTLSADLQALHAPQPLVYSPVFVFKPFTRGAPVPPDGSNIARPASIQGEDQTMWGPADTSIEVQTESANYRLVPGAVTIPSKDEVPAFGSVAAQTQVGGPPGSIRSDSSAEYAIPYSSSMYMQPSVDHTALKSPVIEDDPLGPNMAAYRVPIIPPRHAAFAYLPRSPPTLVTPSSAPSFPPPPNPMDAPPPYEAHAGFYKYQNAAQIDALRLHLTPGSEQPQPNPQQAQSQLRPFPDFRTPKRPQLLGGKQPLTPTGSVYSTPLVMYPRVAPASTFTVPYNAMNYFTFGPPAPVIQLSHSTYPTSTPTDATPIGGLGTSLLEEHSETKSPSPLTNSLRHGGVYKALRKRTRWVPVDGSHLEFTSEPTDV